MKRLNKDNYSFKKTAATLKEDLKALLFDYEGTAPTLKSDIKESHEKSVRLDKYIGGYNPAKHTENPKTNGFISYMFNNNAPGDFCFNDVFDMAYNLVK